MTSGETCCTSTCRTTQALPPPRSQPPEGHNIEYDQSGAVIGMILVNARFLLERDVVLTLSLPPEHLAAAELAPVLVAA
jgi:hypothetical protein